MNGRGERTGQEILPGGWLLSHYRAAELAAELKPGMRLSAGGRVLAPMACAPTAGRLSIGHRQDQPLDETLELAVAGDPVTLPQGPLLLLAEDEGLFPLVWWLAALRQARASRPLVLLGARAFPFQPAPSRILLPDLPPWVIATMPLLDDWQIPGRLAHGAGLPGCHEGEVLELAEHWLSALTAGERPDILLFGPEDWQSQARERLPDARTAYTTR